MKLLGVILAVLAIVFAVVSGMHVGGQPAGLQNGPPGPAGCGGGGPGGPGGGRPPPPPSNSSR